MMVPERLVVRLEQDIEHATWIVMDGQGRRLSQVARGVLSQAATAAKNRHVTFLVPGLNVLTTRAMLPVKTRAKVRQMLPFSLEEIVAEDVEALLFAAGPKQKSGEISVSIVNRQCLDEWLLAIKKAGISPDVVYADSDGVPDTPSVLTLILEGDKTYGRAPSEAPFLLEGFSLTQVLDFCSTNSGDQSDSRHLLIYLDETNHAERAAELALQRAKVASLNIHIMPEGPLEQLASTIVNNPGTNLLQDTYAKKTNLTVLGRPWRLAASLLFFLMVLATLVEWARFFELKREDQALSQMVEEVCNRDLQQPTLSDCQSEVERQLARPLGISQQYLQGFLMILNIVAGAQDSNSQIQALNFQDGIMDLRVTANDVKTLDTFASNMMENGQFEVSIQSANILEDGVEGRMQVIGTSQ